jgi:hypothetical protein
MTYNAHQIFQGNKPRYAMNPLHSDLQNKSYRVIESAGLTQLTHATSVANVAVNSASHVQRDRPIFLDITSDAIQRSVAEGFVQQVFSKKYQAKVSQFLDHLIANYHCGELMSVVGYQAADQSSLYLEQYLETSIDDLLSHASGNAVSRKDIVEVGNLASIKPGAFREVFFLLANLFYLQKRQWVVFTTSGFLLKAFDAMGVERITLAEADPAKLPDQGKQWGTYYQSKPAVIAANVGEGISRLLVNPEFAHIFKQTLPLYCATTYAPCFSEGISAVDHSAQDANAHKTVDSVGVIK